MGFNAADCRGGVMATLAMTSVRRAYSVTPEIYFHKPIDNSRLVRVADPNRKREMRMLLFAAVTLFGFFMAFCWQHYRSIEYGYRNEALRVQRDQMMETQRQLRLDEASLREPWRIDELAHQMGLQSPLAGQVTRLETSLGTETGAPIVARVATVSVISARQ